MANRLFHRTPRELAVALRQLWESIGVAIRPGVSEAELDRFERERGVVLPEDFREYLRVVDGMEAYDTDGELREFYSLDRLRTLADENWGTDNLEDPELYFIFINYFISSHAYAIRLQRNAAGENPVYFVGGDFAPVAGSFSEFVERYLQNPDEVVFPEDG